MNSFRDPKDHRERRVQQAIQERRVRKGTGALLDFMDYPEQL